MKISVLTKSNRYSDAQAAIGALNGLASGKHSITYCSGMDYKADIYCHFSDKAFPLALSWDDIISIVHERAPDSILAWNDVQNPMEPNYLIIPHSWHIISYGIPIFLPLGFHGAWLAEVYKMATAQDIIIPKQLACGTGLPNIRPLRDADFWWKFFGRTRQIRMKEAKEIYKERGFTHDFSAICQEVIRAGLDKHAACRKIAADETADTAPDSDYIDDKWQAESMLTALGLDA